MESVVSQRSWSSVPAIRNSKVQTLVAHFFVRAASRRGRCAPLFCDVLGVDLLHLPFEGVRVPRVAISSDFSRCGIQSLTH